MSPDVQRHIRALLDAHDEAFRAFRAASDALDVVVADHGTAIASLGSANQALASVNKAHSEAIGAALAANRAVIDLLERLSNERPPSS